MDKAIIFNVYDFVSFQFCKSLLNDGVEVRGIHTNDPSEPFLEEKKLEIGRNANYEEISFHNLVSGETEKTTVILSLYDFYMLHKEALLKAEPFKLALSRNVGDLVLILPVQLLADPLGREELTPLKTLLNLAAGKRRRIYFFYLPTVYGQWQPATFLFQQTILTNMNKAEAFKGIRESTNDCLYIDDAVETMLSVLKKRKPGKYILQSGLEDYWKRCADYIRVKQIPKNSHERFELGDDIERVALINTTSLMESLSVQINHVQRLYSMEASGMGLEDGRT